MIKTTELEQKVSTLTAERKNVLNKDFERLGNNLDLAIKFLEDLEPIANALEPLRLNIQVKTSCGLYVAFNSGYIPTFIYNGRHWNADIIAQVNSKELLLDYEIAFAEMVENVSINDLDLDLAITQALVDFKNTTDRIKDTTEEDEDEDLDFDF